MSMKVENWCGYDIRFVEINGEWWAILKDICDALNLKTFDVSQRLASDMLERVPVEVTTDIPSNYRTKDDMGLNGVTKSEKDDMGLKYNRFTKRVWMLAVNELGIYEALFASRRLEARKFRMWAGEVMQKLRKSVGLQGYEIMRMTDPDIQEEIDWILDSLYWDDEKKCVMQSITVAGGDVEQVYFLKEVKDE